ncbi:MAG: peptidase M4, thermolysin [Bacteroidetes bacterium]|nr:MAG: peptidase M4, thermolysin [Bacteroidota bacterium]
MKLKSYVLIALSCTTSVIFAQQSFTGSEANRICPGSETVLINKQSQVPSFIAFAKGAGPSAMNVFSKLRGPLKMQPADEWQHFKTTKDNLGFTHYRYRQFYNNIPVKGGEYIIHEKNGAVESVNGMFFNGLQINTNPSVSVQDALSRAMAYVHARIYKWQLPEEETMLKHIKNDLSATYFPQGELLIIAERGDIFKRNMKLAWKFDIYAAEPMSRQYVYLDAHTGEIIHFENRIHEIDVPATANTMYSGTQNITCDNFSAGQYRLREAARGQGIHTFNLANSTNQGNAVDFVNNSTNWTSTVNDDHTATDAHWGAEKTYDYYLSQHNRNGIDGSGMLMVSYVHYGSNYNNAFWDGQSMSYGDGSQQSGGFNPLTGIDVCGHEFTHGVTENTAGLDYQDESGALNESFSDMFGTSIEFYSKPLTANFQIGEEIVVNQGSALRSMSNPNQFGDPDCYNGTNWYTGTADNGGVHTNSGVQNFWFYLLCQGGSGTNDLGDSYSVTGLGINNAAQIAFRNLTVYLISTSQYADARTYAIQSAQDIFGACSPEVVATANAWYACGVGGLFSATAAASFTSDITSGCSVPLTVNFSNTSTNVSNATWNFGDNTTSTQYNPAHVYTASGTYNVQLSVSGACGSDSVIQSAYVTVNAPAAPAVTGAGTCTVPASVTLSANGTGTLEWFTQPSGGTSVNTGTSYTTPLLSSTTTYYVESQVAQAPGNVGPPTYSFGGGGNHNNTSIQWLEFDVFQNCTLATALVNAPAAGNRTFTLWDSQGNQVNQYTVNVPTGVNTITLNIPLTPGSYRIGGTQMNLYRNNSGAAYPYTFNNVVEITGSSAGPNYYYYLYDWSMTLSPCTGPRVPVTASIGAPSVSYTAADYDTVCYNVTAPFALTGGSPAGGTYSGPGVTGGTFDPNAAGPGSHTITYSYTDTQNGNCTGTATQIILVDVCTGVQQNSNLVSLNVFPNPADGNFTVLWQSPSAQTVSFRMFDLLGQTVLDRAVEAAAGATRLDINAGSWAKGVYLLQVKSGETLMTQRVVIR